MTKQIIACVGSWGTGKSTVRKILGEMIINPELAEYGDQVVSFNNAQEIYKLINSVPFTKNRLIVTYEAMQFEETSQVTSELYNKIANTIIKQKQWKSKLLLSILPYSAYRKLRTIAYLKKESFGSNISTTVIMSVLAFIIVDILVRLISENKDKGYIQFLKKFFITSHGLLFWVFVTVLILLNSDKILKGIIGYLARASHVDVLKTISLDSQLFLLIDEIDRLSPEAVKILFDEVLILKEAWNISEKKGNDLIVFMFYDENVILHQYKQLKTYEPHIFLQKFYDEVYRLPEQSFIYEVWELVNRCWVAKIGMYVSNIDNDKHNARAVNTVTHSEGVQNIPTKATLKLVASLIVSFRQLDKFKFLVEDYTKRWQLHSLATPSPDIYIIALTIYFLYGIKFVSKDKIQDNYSFCKVIEHLEQLHYLEDPDILSKLNNVLDQIEIQYHGFNEIGFFRDKIFQKILLEPQLHVDNIERDYCSRVIKNIEFLPFGPFDDNYNCLYDKVYSSTGLDIVTIINGLSYSAMQSRWFFCHGPYKNIKIDNLSFINKNCESRKNLVDLIQGFLKILLSFRVGDIEVPGIQGRVLVLDEKIAFKAIAEKLNLVIFKYVGGNRTLINYLVILQLLELVSGFSHPDIGRPKYKSYLVLIKDILIKAVPAITVDRFYLLNFESNLYLYPTFAAVIKTFFSEEEFHDQFSEFDQRVDCYKDFLVFTAITKNDPLKISEFIKNNVEQYTHKLYSTGENNITKKLIDDYLYQNRV